MGHIMNDKAIEVYRGLLLEIRFRIEAIDDVISGKVRLRAKIAEEFCYLQLRMICEIIAIGCLVIHGELSSLKSDLFKTYKADWIMSELAKLHPKFFPAPLEIKDDATTNPPSWVYLKSGFLTHRELAILWNRHTGAALHRGGARNNLWPERPLDFNKITIWREKIVALLNRHVIPSADEELIWHFLMLDQNGDVTSNLFKRVDVTPPMSP